MGTAQLLTLTAHDRSACIPLVLPTGSETACLTLPAPHPHPPYQSAHERWSHATRVTTAAGHTNVRMYRTVEEMVLS